VTAISSRDCRFFWPIFLGSVKIKLINTDFINSDLINTNDGFSFGVFLSCVLRSRILHSRIGTGDMENSNDSSQNALSEKRAEAELGSDAKSSTQAASFGPSPSPLGVTVNGVSTGGRSWGALWVLLGLSLVFFTAFLLSSGLAFFWRSNPGGQAVSSFGGQLFDSGKVGVIELKGVIMDSKKALRELKQMADADEVRAVVIRLNSPGGSVAPSQEIHDAVKNFPKPIVASMGSVAASGAFYVAVAADRVFANPGTLTGSIGVIMEFANLSKLYEWAKVERYSLKTGKFKDAGAEYRPMDPESRELLQGVINDVLNQFKAAVVEGRKITTEEINAIADGRIFSGRQALGLKLVDELGGIESAIQSAAKMAKIKGEPKVVYPSSSRTPAWMELFADQSEEEATARPAIQSESHTLKSLMRLADSFSRTIESGGVPNVGPELYWLWSSPLPAVGASR
jgi:protease-4